MHRDKLLELSVLSYHRLSPKQVSIKRFTASGGSLGRSEQADWYLPDPERVVSGIHAEITFNQGHYYIIDKSTNGLFVNRAVDALGENSHQLQSADILCLGDYEIQVQLIEHGAATAEKPKPSTDKAQHKQQLATQISSVESGFSIDHFTAPRVAGAMSQMDTSAMDHSASSFNAQGHSQHQDHKNNPNSIYNQSQNQNHDLAMDDHYLAPAALIPDDWNNAWSSHSEPVLTEKMPDKPATTSRKTAVNNGVDEQSQLTAFLTGLGVADLDANTLTGQQWQQLGSALQQSILGLIDVMRARSKVKNSFRVNQTTFQQRENNPLKFSASMDEAFHNLFNRPSSSFMPAKQAIAEAFNDIAEHEAAMLAGVAGISNGLLAQLAPRQFEQADFSQSFIDKINPAQRQARLWQHYRLTHSNLTTELKSTSNGGVNDDFISAYEQYLAKR
ncbi:type VI secretion system-associated FHA domain protein TagH [Rheinheimera salexigens]|uniref:FHA domain-containing protein n=1 Tax=Rheinheimera salexigens TaxID=1628148 RepID=A0A1E7Q6I5_9GAMM|nr:type VI secretion system-associated FHA domain protein TagH [Rheinheimera salexigens]OEY69747.1 hypothetical protein BI198_09350 [Rheinheimera salexigens]